jgi:hypothetical protein
VLTRRPRKPSTMGFHSENVAIFAEMKT